MASGGPLASEPDGGVAGRSTAKRPSDSGLLYEPPMPVRPPSVVNVVAPLNSCAPAAWRISSAKRAYSSSSERVDGRASIR